MVSIEPAEHIDISEQFYVLPILEAEQAWLASGYTTRLLRVASIPIEDDPLSQGPGREELLQDYRVGIVFAIDTTSSMGPYIERTREAVRRIYQQIEGSGIADRVSFGMVGYRDNVEVAPELDYVSQVFAPLEPHQDPRRFLDQIDFMSAAPVSSRGFNEDAMAGRDDGHEHAGMAGLRRPLHHPDHRCRAAPWPATPSPPPAWDRARSTRWPSRTASPSSACTC